MHRSVLVVGGAPPENRLHQAIGYVTPNDEHEGRGDAIRQARIEGLRQAHDARITYHRRNHTHPTGDQP